MNDNLQTLTAQVVVAHVSHNFVASSDLADLIQQVYKALSALGAEPVEQPIPAVPIKNSITPEYLVCLEDGKKLKMMKRHLATSYNLTPEQYRMRWGLPKTYPMVAPNAAAKRSRLAKTIGLGRRLAPAPVPSKPEKPTRPRAKKAA